MKIKPFGNTIKPLFSDKKGTLQNSITIIDDGILYTEQQVVAEKLNNLFVDAIDDLEIKPCITDEGILSHNIPEILKRYENHPSIVNITENVQIEDKFVFKDVTSSQIKHEIVRTNPKKSCTGNDIPAKILIDNSDILSEYLANIYNNSKNNQNYPISMKIADVIPVYKPNEENDKVFKKNYRPVSLIPIVSKVFERNMFNEISLYIDKFLSSYLFGYRKGHSAEPCLVTMIEFWRKALDNKK